MEMPWDSNSHRENYGRPWHGLLPQSPSAQLPFDYLWPQDRPSPAAFRIVHGNWSCDNEFSVPRSRPTDWLPPAPLRPFGASIRCKWLSEQADVHDSPKVQYVHTHEHLSAMGRS